MTNKIGETRPRGRPRGFDRTDALARAARTFWQLGYEGASIADLTAAMAITPQSLYAAFASKAELYREAVAWYQAEMGAVTGRTLAEEEDALAALEWALIEAAREFSRAGRPHGCMVSTALLTCAAENEAVAQHVAALRAETLALLRARVERGISEGHIRRGTDAPALARLVGALIQGMSVQAQDGASEDELIGIARLAGAQLRRHRASGTDP